MSERKKGAVAALCSAIALFTIYTGVTGWRENARKTSQRDILAERIDTLAAPSDRVLFWGAIPTATIYRTNRLSGSRIFNSVPLMHGVITYRRLAPIVLTDIEQLAPKLIVEKDDEMLPALLAPTSALHLTEVTWDNAELRTRKLALSHVYKLVWRDEASGAEVFVRH